MAHTSTATITLDSGTESKLAGHFKRNRFVYTVGALAIAVGASLRIYLDTMGFAVGTDYFSDEFQAYWMPLLYG